MAVNLENDGKIMLEENAEQRQKKITKCERMSYTKNGRHYS
jgi:hypothetical protein